MGPVWTAFAITSRVSGVSIMHRFSFRSVRRGRSARRRRVSIAFNTIAMPALLVAALVGPSAAAATSAQLTASPTTTTAGTSIAVRGSGFPKNLKGYVALDSASVGTAFRVNGKGTFSVSLTVPANETSGQHNVAARSGSGTT